MIRRTVLVHGRRCYLDSVRTKELSPRGAIIVFGDNVDPHSNDWDRRETPAVLQITFTGGDSR